MPLPKELEFYSDTPLDPEEIRFSLDELPGQTLLIIDEFDQVEDDEGLSLLADTVKTLSDHGSPITLMFVGVAQSIEALLGEHESIIRNVQQIPMPRMSVEKLEATIDQGFGAIKDLSITDTASAGSSTPRKDSLTSPMSSVFIPLTVR